MSFKPVTAEEPSRREVWKMFDRIAPRYDLINRLLSFGLDICWRRRMARYLPEAGKIELLDAATGTGDQMFMLIKRQPRIRKALGVDMSEAMMAVGREKCRRFRLDDRVEFKTGDAQRLPVADRAVNAVTMSFGIRNVVDMDLVFREMLRVLKPGGRACILEFSTPPSAVVRFFYLFYLRHILPRAGGWISGDAAAYRYLNRTIESFPCGQFFCDRMTRAGFKQARFAPLSMGIATIYYADA
jgi:demethylmenaquinone methyltransferase/2-methoxy-6-polyprenyl-1,4-benzoquinol methylase